MLVVNHQWLQAWLDATIPSPEQVEDFLLRQGFETEPVAPIFTQDIVIGEVIEVHKHPNADKLNLCKVRISDQTTVEIVCGCPSVKVGIKVATALDGARLGTFKIEKRKLRGVLSNGMLCSMQELGLKVSSNGIWHLDPLAPLGQSLDSWLQRSSSVYGIELTPNRGDCLSVRGIAREFAIGLSGQSTEPWSITSEPEFLSLPVLRKIEIEEKAAPLIDAFHLVKLDKISANGASKPPQTPDWMKVRLLEAGFSLHHCVVDILNYAMLETGQPFHAYTGKLSDKFSLGFGLGKTEVLLNGEEAEVNHQTLVIKNESKPVCIAGYMGMLESASTMTDQSIYLEAAGFQSSQIAFHCRSYPWHTQSGSRFERGIDFDYTAKAMQRAIDLLATYAGYKPKSRSFAKGTANNPKAIQLPFHLVADILGFDCPEDKIKAALVKVGCQIKALKTHCEVRVPTWRNDLQIPESLVSEYLRIYGMPKSVQRGIKATLNVNATTHSVTDQCIDQLKQFMIGQGFCETYSYSFGDASDMLAFHKDEDTLVTLRNPISSAFKTMRPSLLPGLLRQIKKNLAKQVTDIRLFEVGQCFHSQSDDIVEQCMLSAMMVGTVLPESWQDGGALCFTHAKSMMQRAVQRLPLRRDHKLAWQPAVIAGMHPHQSGQLVSGDSVVGQCGLLHPEIMKKMKIQQDIFAFSISIDWLVAHLGHEIYQSVSNQPTMRRDLSLIVPESVPYAKIKEEIQSSIFQYLIKIVIFDIYRGSQIPKGCYSISLGLIFQSEEKTLVDEELVPMINSLVANLHNKLNIKTRGGND